jgi:hypothetical protein
MPRKLRRLKITEVSTVGKGSGNDCVVAIRKADLPHTFNVVVRKDAQGRGTVRREDIEDMAQYLGVKAKKLLKILNAPPAPKRAFERAIPPKPAQSFNQVIKMVPKPTPPPAKESFYTTLCKYAATKARPEETPEQAFARVATTDKTGIDLMVAQKVADVTSNRANFWPKPLPKEPDRAVVNPETTSTADTPPAAPAPGGTGYGRLMQLAYEWQGKNGGTIEQAFALMADANPDLFQIAKAQGPLFSDPEDEQADDEAEPDDDPDDEKVKKQVAEIMSKHQGWL